MAASALRSLALLTGLCACVCASLASPAQAAVETPADERSVTMSADVLSSDFRSDTIELQGNVRVAQGPMSIQSQQATARNVGPDTSEWTFRDDVRIRTAQADMLAQTASASIVGGQIAAARVTGTPAEFEQRLDSGDGRVRGRAAVIDYDFLAGVVRLENDVWFTNGTDEFRGDVVIYDVRGERVQINPDGQSGGRVRGVIRPRDRTNGAPDSAPDSVAPQPQAPAQADPPPPERPDGGGA